MENISESSKFLASNGDSPCKEYLSLGEKKTINASPHKGPLSDYSSPLKGPTSIASFFAPPQIIKSPVPSLNASPQKIISSPSYRIIPMAHSKLTVSPLKPRIEDSGSDLTLSEGEDEEEIKILSSAKSLKSVDKNCHRRSIPRAVPFNLDSDDEKKEKVSPEEESGSDISVIISLPSTDSNEPPQNSVIRSQINFSNSEYDSDAKDDEAVNDNEKDIPFTVRSEDDNNRTTGLVFNSNHINAEESALKIQPLSPERKSRMKVKILPESVKPVEPPLKRGIQDIETNTVPISESDISLKRPMTTHNNNVQVNSVNCCYINPQVNPVLIKTVVQTDDPASTDHVTLDKSPDETMLSKIVPLNSQALFELPKSKTGYVYDERLLHHFDPNDPEHPEKPARITSIFEKLRSARLLERSHHIPIHGKLSEFAAEIQAVHDIKYCRMINQTSLVKNVEELNQISSKFNSVYINPSTAISATVAAVATIELCMSIGRGEIENGFAIVRPPGHHAEHDEAMGFCIYNNCAVAASSLLRKNLARKILILDWDVHHGNGTQNAFADNDDVLYVSLHRFDCGKFYPHFEDASHQYVGTGAGLGTSVNVAWNGPGFGDGDYLYAFNRLIMPIAREFNPDFVIVSAGFDAAAGDPIGECELTTFGYSMMLHELMSLAGGKLALVLEGGYNLEVISKCYEACVRMLLKEAPPKSELPMIASPKAVYAVENSVVSLSPYWKCLFPKPAQLSLNENTTQFPLSTILDHFWKQECEKHFKLSKIPGIFKSYSESFIQKYSSRVLASEGILFSPEVLIIFAHESGPIYTNNFMSSLCFQSSKINQCQPFLPLLKAAHKQSNYSFIDINLPTRTWKLKQTSLGNEVESQELNTLFSLLWDKLISRSGCKNVFFVAAGSPIYSIGHLINSHDLASQVRGCFFFSSSLFIPVINSTPARSEWYQQNVHVVVPSQEPIKKAIVNTAAAFGSCFSAGQWLMNDSASAVGNYKVDILNFIRTRIQR